MNKTFASLLITLTLLSTAVYLYWGLTQESLRFDFEGDEDESEYC